MNDYNLKNSLGYLTNKVHSLLKIILNREFKQAGFNLTTEHWAVLFIILTNPESTQSFISEKSLRDKTNVTRIIDSLEKQNLVTRNPDKRDRRAHLISITEEGKETIQKLIPIVVEVNKFAEQNINEQDLEITKNVLTQILTNIIPKIKIS